MIIAVAGTGYVGLSIAVLLSQFNKVIAVDVLADKVNKINNRISPIADREIEEYLVNKKLNLTATIDGDEAYKQADYVVIATPTNYDPQKNYFDTTSVESVIEKVTTVNPKAYIVIKSTIPVGFSEGARRKFSSDKILFSPEFLREGQALYDNLYPNRIVVGAPKCDTDAVQAAQKFASFLLQGALKKDVPVYILHLPKQRQSSCLQIHILRCEWHILTSLTPMPRLGGWIQNL